VQRVRLLAIGAVGAVALAGCAASPAASGPQLLIWTDPLKAPAVQEVADGFASEYGIEVDVQIISSELQSNFVTADAAGNGPDVVVGAHDWVGNLVQNGSIDPLPLAPEAMTAYSDTAIEAMTYAGRLYGIPYGVEAIALYRNTDVVPNEPSTLDQAFTQGQAAVDAGKVESAFNLPVGQNGDAYHMEPLLTSLGGYLFGRDGEGSYDPTDLGIGKPGSLAAAERIAQLGESGKGVLRRSISTDNSIALFTAGRAAFLVSGPWALADVRASGISYGLQPMPGFRGEEPAQPFMGAQAFMVASHGSNTSFAQEFVTEGVNNEQAMTTMYELAGLPPAMTVVAEKAGAEDPDIAIFTDAANAGSPMPAIPAMSAVWEPLGKAYSAIVGGADPDATMRTAGATINDAISGG
jgi:arabinogalactan oligomer/maltooligosaccharide transport system substrate-binding protein